MSRKIGHDFKSSGRFFGSPKCRGRWAAPSFKIAAFPGEVEEGDESGNVLLLILRNHRELVDPARPRLGADPFVIALARIRGSTVVTQETPTGSPLRLKIPDVCGALGIPCINVLQFIRQQGWVF